MMQLKKLRFVGGCRKLIMSVKIDGRQLSIFRERTNGYLGILYVYKDLITGDKMVKRTKIVELNDVAKKLFNDNFCNLCEAEKKEVMIKWFKMKGESNGRR